MFHDLPPYICANAVYPWEGLFPFLALPKMCSLAISQICALCCEPDFRL